MRILGEGVTTLLEESKLPDSFWAECLSAFIHVLNRTSTSAVPNATPYGLAPNQMSLDLECGDALHMYTFRRTSALIHLDLTCRSVSSLVILQDTRVGSSTTQPRKSHQ
jgi:hypothetical protein